MRAMFVSFAAALCLAAGQPALAAGFHGQGACAGSPTSCAECGGHVPCRRVVCRVVCDYKEVEKTCWDTKCEEYCLPIPKLCHHGESCQSGCGACAAAADCTDCGGACGACQGGVQAGKLRVRKKLMKRTIKVKVPVYKCQVKYLCGACEAEAAKAAPQESKSATNAALLPPAPKHAWSLPPLPKI